MKVVVVEDERMTQIFITEILQEQGYQVEVRGSGEAALDLSHSAEPVALVIDIHLADGMSGYDYVQTARHYWPKAGVVYISGNRANIAGKRLGRNERFMPKPFGAAELIAAVKDVIGTD